MQKKKKGFSVYDIVVVALMAAMIFVVTSFVRIPIEVPPAGETMLKVANVLCLLAGMWFGGVRGGLAAGIGSMLFDLSNPKYVASAPFTLLFFFMMAFICGTIAHAGGAKGKRPARNVAGAVCGAVSYVILYISKNVIELMLAAADGHPCSFFPPARRTRALRIRFVFLSILSPPAYSIRIPYTGGIYKKKPPKKAASGGEFPIPFRALSRVRFGGRLPPALFRIRSPFLHIAPAGIRAKKMRTPDP